MSPSEPSPQASPSKQTTRRRLMPGCLLALASVGLCGAALLVWYYWPPTELALARVQQAHVGDVLAVAFAPDGKHLATGGRDGQVKLWDLGAQQQSVTLLAQNASVTSVAFSPDGQTLAVAGGACGLITLCDPIRLTQRLSWKGDSDDDPSKVGQVPGRPGIDMPPGATNEPARYHPKVYGISYSPDGRLLASTGPSSMRIWDAETGKERARCASNPGIGWPHAAFSRDGRRLASSSSGGVVQLWDSNTGKETAVLKHQGDWLFQGVVISPDGKMAVVPVLKYHWLDLLDSCGIIALDTTSGKPLADVYVASGCRPYEIVYSPDGKLLACAAVTRKGSPITYLLEAGSWRRLAQTRAEPDGIFTSQAIAFSPDGDQLVTGESNGSIRFWDVSPYRSR